MLTAFALLADSVTANFKARFPTLPASIDTLPIETWTPLLGSSSVIVAVAVLRRNTAPVGADILMLNFWSPSTIVSPRTATVTDVAVIPAGIVRDRV